MALNSIDDILADLRQGRMVIIMDDEDRENEGDLLMAASLVRPEDVNFMARYGRGLICLTLTRERCQQLHLPLMVQDNATPFSTNFTVSIEAAQGVTTGISAYDRAHTIRTAVRPDARPEDLVQPGHIFPLMAQPGGVLTRAGHTEAGCDLTRLAGLEPAAMIVEVLNDDGSMARRADLEQFAEQHGLKIGTIAALIRYRMQNEKTVERVADAMMNTEFGPFRVLTYQDVVSRQVHFALVRGEIHPDQPVLVRVHVQHLLSDLLTLRLPDSGWPLRDTLQRVANEPAGVLVCLSHPEDPAALIRRMRGYQFGATEAPRADQNAELRTYGIGAQILLDIGVRRMRVLSAPKRITGLSGFNLEVVEYVS
ncbi:MAG: bifunctional 3,4-dihydroxy-2-butanone-4-phosphate synthase/GTP cyclohydrolase II [Candidatus Competibacteraceae bacterium]|uniref:3,4-dihydroxy-2-butanone 4-phosphate synthase n=1 Tax=Candidatus Contendobacter odensis Run_B_J11 TaxID=1400861 RepID=A0A7U7GE08_9GAMM|nr:bifunctional 3,4-dihydroxy-2-butanone-4-phosphate synthase/GTP cyclohydrolase II [Candidatus Contendobacter odensis]MBK8535789.1 bifunctional 3,4-dihydroxy-2-butanone-4-phosphate synthase/GTP cyclohydrolase II [Candidatus Competibacteraceae bacterium]MBK8750819.1 bifunctional 3,4-dihydroxy-2-butanone-4-phosphate synthase/GTP cyclohydrolase II [Candidatus Competibacteraceae bacterium]CDH46524.1 bifunctional protein (Includes: 3,4-dihydroxy-2-butanone 4-phosphate synthase; GTP cyclohydrolase II